MIFSDSFLKQPLLKIDFQNWVTNRLQKYFLGFSNNHLEVVKIRKKLMWSEARRTNLHSKDFIFAVSPRMFHPLPPYHIVTCDCLGPVRYSLASLVNQFFKFSSIKQLHP